MKVSRVNKQIQAEAAETYFKHASFKLDMPGLIRPPPLSRPIPEHVFQQIQSIDVHCRSLYQRIGPHPSCGYPVIDHFVTLRQTRTTREALRNWIPTNTPRPLMSARISLMSEEHLDILRLRTIELANRILRRGDCGILRLGDILELRTSPGARDSIYKTLEYGAGAAMATHDED